MKMEKTGVHGIPSTLQERDSLRLRVETYADQQGLVPPLSMEELRDHALELAPSSVSVDYVMVLLNNAVWRETVASIPYERRLLLLPQCLRDFKNCPAEMDEFGLLCEECGRCNIGELQSLAEDLGYVVLVAEGSTVVTRLLDGGKVDAVIGVSCLNALEKSFPHMADGAIPGLAIPLNAGGCIDTTTDVEHVRNAIRLRSDASWVNQVDTARIREMVEGWFSAIEIDSMDTRTEQIAYEWVCGEGKRWRPYLLACTYDALSGADGIFPEKVRRLALAVECFHKASLIHDDIEDDDEVRYNAPTLHCQYGIPVALNAGDFLVGEGYRLIASVPSRTADLMRIAVENHRMLCVGQGEELRGLVDTPPFTAAQLIEIFRRKTAPAFGAALRLGALAAGGDDRLDAALRRFSESLGIAYQIHDDLEEYRSGEEHDLRASILLALANDQRPLEWYAPDSPNLDHVFREMMVEEKAAQLLEHYKNEAIRALNPLASAPLKSLLRRTTSKMLTPAGGRA
ncbi:MAG: polyprenyl synthetase family protein [Pontiellaceae bacterium]|nr:polyprenyl synthetase family protein [Pontiellaceae bacterium]MBN2786081.1 polyprenyl synthetase family protein [Pontiellaceae bacterium]